MTEGFRAGSNKERAECRFVSCLTGGISQTENTQGAADSGNSKSTERCSREAEQGQCGLKIRRSTNQHVPLEARHIAESQYSDDLSSTPCHEGARERMVAGAKSLPDLIVV